MNHIAEAVCQLLILLLKHYKYLWCLKLALFVIHVVSGCLKYLFYLTRKSLEITNFFSRENLVKRVPQYKTTPLPTDLFTAFFIYYYDFSKYVLSLHLYINSFILNYFLFLSCSTGCCRCYTILNNFILRYKTVVKKLRYGS